MEVYKKVRAYIEENGYKQLAVAQKAGISKVTFNAMMNGKQLYSITKGYAIQTPADFL